VFGQMRKRGGKNGFRNRFVQQSHELRFFLNEDLLDFLLETVYSTSTKTIEELLCDARQQNPSWSSSFITYHLLWLTKQGFLTFAF
jgi:hypothetical protein